jgi:hypothetical protein
MADRKELRLKMIDMFRKSANLQRLNERIPINDPDAVLLICELGSGNVLNFSGTGISIQLQTILSRGSRVTINIDTPNHLLRQALKQHEIFDIVAEVRWNYQSALGVVHGLVFHSFTERQAEAFVHLVGEFAFNNAEFGTVVGDSKSIVT